MLPAVVAAASNGAVFQDPLGERRPISDSSGADTREFLCLRGEITSAPSFEFALRERVSRLAGFRHSYYARIRSVERLSDGTLALVSDQTPGVRLSQVLESVDRQRLTLDINTALSLIRQLVPTVAVLHEHAPDIAHGAIGPERLILTPHARVIIVEHVFGAALEQLRYSHAQCWRELRIPLPRSSGLPRFDHRADVTQIGVVALSLVLGRLLQEDEYPHVGDVVASAWAISARGGLEPLPPGFRSWLMRALQLDPAHSFSSAVEARNELDKMDYIAAPQALETFVERYQASLDRAAGPAPTTDPPKVTSAPRLVEAPKVSRPTLIEAPAAEASEATEAPETEHALLAPIAAAVSVAPPRSVEPPSWAAVITPTVPIDFAQFAQFAQEEPTVPKVMRPRRWPRLVASAAVVLAILSGAALAGRRYFVSHAAGLATGTLMINTNPGGAQVVVDGQPRGVSPITLTLGAGTHVVELRGEGDPRSIPITIAAGAQLAQYVDLPKVAMLVGQLRVRTEPTGAKVSVDGIARGVSPVIVADLTPGVHAVTFDSETGSARHEVTVEAGITGSLVVTLAPSQTAPTSGWIAVKAPIDVQLFENGRLLGTSESDRIMVSAGKHEIEIANQPVGYRAVRTVQVAPGKVTPIAIELPKQKLALNAVPWAEVWIDGEKIGDTPIGDHVVSAGPHEVIFRHPELGEQRHAITVTVAAPARLSVDMRKK